MADNFPLKPAYSTAKLCCNLWIICGVYSGIFPKMPWAIAEIFSKVALRIKLVQENLKTSLSKALIVFYGI